MPNDCENVLINKYFQQGIVYSFGMRATDDKGNRSPLSNIAGAKCTVTVPSGWYHIHGYIITWI